MIFIVPTDPLEKLDDAQFIAAFEQAAVSPPDWTHAAHIRMAWIYLQSDPATALPRTRESLKRFAAFHKVLDALDRGYHETLTQAWLRVVAAAMRHGESHTDSRAFCAANPHLLCKTLLRLYYTRPRIMTPEAKARFVEPDIAPLPA